MNPALQAGGPWFESMIAHEGEAWFRKPGFFYLRAFFYGGLGHPGELPGGSLVRIHDRPRRRSLV